MSKTPTDTTPKSSSQQNQVIFKIIIVGNAGTGKSCLLNRFVKNEFTDEYNATIGVEFQSQQVQIDEQTKIKMQIWDTCGQESFQSIVRSFYRNSTAVLIVYNIADKSSFESVQQWYSEAQSNALENSVFVLIGAQKDRDNERQVQYEEGVQFMKDNNMHLFFETSAFDGANIEKAFQETGKLIFMNYLNQKLKQGKTEEKQEEQQKAQVLKPELARKKKKNKNKGGCC